jgi:hypothetical protein
MQSKSQLKLSLLANIPQIFCLALQIFGNKLVHLSWFIAAVKQLLEFLEHKTHMLPLWWPELSGEGDLGEAYVHKGELLGVKGILEGIGQLQRNFGLGEGGVQTVSKPAHYNKVDGGR